MPRVPLYPMPVALKKNVVPKFVGRSRRRVDGPKRMEWILREVDCIAKSASRSSLLFLTFGNISLSSSLM